MRKSRFSEQQIIAVLREQIFYPWEAKYGGMGASDATKLKSLQDENHRLKKLLAEAMLDVAALKDVLGKK